MTAVIFSHQRCGSSNLIHFLVAAYGLSLSEPDYYEPLNLRRMGERDIAWQDGDNRFDAYCAKVMQATPVLKHIYGQLPPRLDRHVAAQSSGVIFLFRKNLKLAALSSAIARRSNTWQARPEQPLGRIEPDDIRDIARSMKAKRNRGLQECRASKTPLLILPYEDLFPSGENAATLRQQTLKAVLDFLGQHTSLTVPCQEQMQAAFDRHIAPDRKLNTASTYRLVDNIDEIQASLSLTGQLGF